MQYLWESMGKVNKDNPCIGYKCEKDKDGKYVATVMGGGSVIGTNISKDTLLKTIDGAAYHNFSEEPVKLKSVGYNTNGSVESTLDIESDQIGFTQRDNLLPIPFRNGSYIVVSNPLPTAYYTDMIICLCKNSDDLFVTNVNGETKFSTKLSCYFSDSNDVSIITSNSDEPTQSETSVGESDAEGSGYRPTYESMFGDDAYTSRIADLDTEDFANINNISGVFGLPYQFLPEADVRLNAENSSTLLPSIGYEYAEKIVERIPLLLIAPGRASFMTKYSKNEKKNFVSQFISSVANGLDFNENTLSDLTESNGRYYTFQYADDYYKYLNPMCRIASIYLGIGDIKLPGASNVLKYMNWEEYTNAGIRSISDVGTFNSIPFYLNTETSTRESYSNSTSQSMLASSVNSISDMGRELSFLLGQSFSMAGIDKVLSDADISSNIENLNDFVNKILGHGNVLSNIGSHLATVAAGGKLIFPEIWSDSSFSRTYSCEFKFISPDPSPLSIYLNVLVPLFHLICLTCPQSVVSNPNGYTNPYLVRAIYKGFFNIDMGIITDMSVTKGDECQWTREGLPSAINVSIDIKDLYQAMSITPSSMSDWSYDTISNTALMDYIANLCGINIYKPEVGRLAEMWIANKGGEILDIKNNTFRKVEVKVQNAIMNFYNKLRGAN